MAMGFDYSTYVPKMRRRMVRLMMPYLTWNLIFFGVYFGLSIFFPMVADSMTKWGIDTFSGFCLQIFSPFRRPADGSLWFMRTIVIYATIFPLLWSCLKGRCRMLLFFGGVIVYVIYSHVTGTEKRLLFSFPAYSVLAYVFGAFCSHARVSLTNLFNGPVVLLCCGALGARCLFGLSGSILGSWIWNVGACMGIPIWFFIGSTVVRRISQSRLYSLAEANSYFVYASHVLVCSLVSHTLARLCQEQFPGKFTVFVIIYCVAGIAICWLLNWIVRKVASPFAALLNGEL